MTYGLYERDNLEYGTKWYIYENHKISPKNLQRLIDFWEQPIRTLTLINVYNDKPFTIYCLEDLPETMPDLPKEREMKAKERQRKAEWEKIFEISPSDSKDLKNTGDR